MHQKEKRAKKVKGKNRDEYLFFLMRQQDQWQI